MIKAPNLDGAMRYGGESYAAHLIGEERRRQIKIEGWTLEHDDTHTDGEMLRAAVIYMNHGTERQSPIQPSGAPLAWPWGVEWWKPKDRRRNLIRAGALCLAEKQRLSRAGKPSDHVNQKLGLILTKLSEVLEGDGNDR